ncbi:MAG: allophanate hydrolase [Gammaproteobacteria bacterium]|nr:allophanate hydrolase [Gammaproteobacteria bacterium]
MSNASNLQLNRIDMTIPGLLQHYRNGDFTPAQLLQTLQAEFARDTSNPVWIHALSAQEVEPYLRNLEGKSADQLPLYGIPFAIKDNIDLAGIPTTAACPAFAYTPQKSAHVVELLVAAGAIPLGKTNLDQFATGLVGVRSPEPWGPCHNAFNADYISGGSSSGSALAVAKGWASFSLGTDTAGSGRVPAALNNIVGLKPSKGLLSTQGLVPACRSLDCISIFALTCADANRVFDIAARFDASDAFSHANPYSNSKRYFGPPATTPVIGVPAKSELEFFGDSDAQDCFTRSIDHLQTLGWTLREMSIAPFVAAARLLYQGPWVAERTLVTQALLEQNPAALLPVIRRIVEAGLELSALDSFRAQYQLQQLIQQAQPLLQAVDAIITPTIGTTYRIGEVQSDPIQLNSNLGYYNNFMNLMDLAAVTVPTGFFQHGCGFGVTLFHRAFEDKRLLALAAQLHAVAAPTLGATALKNPPCTFSAKGPQPFIPVVVCGAHLEGLALHWQLAERGAHKIESTTTAARYRMYALAGGPPFRPGLMREANGVALPVEVWAVPREQFGSFVADIAAPLGIGKVELADGRWESGFICEPYGLQGAEDITELGGWKPYLARGPR